MSCHTLLKRSNWQTQTSSCHQGYSINLCPSGIGDSLWTNCRLQYRSPSHALLFFGIVPQLEGIHFDSDSYKFKLQNWPIGTPPTEYKYPDPLVALITPYSSLCIPTVSGQTALLMLDILRARFGSHVDVFTVISYPVRSPFEKTDCEMPIGVI